MVGWRPDVVERAELGGTARVVKAGTELRLLCWNLQFGAGRSREFFYDGGDEVFVPAEDVRATLAGMAPLVASADIALLSEVDRGSDRTGRIDELGAFYFPVTASAPYHRAWVPFPPQRWLGRVEMHLCIGSRVALGEAVRHALPLMNEPWWRRAFNLRRAMLTTIVKVEGGRPLHVALTHLSAFTRGDDTLTRQVAVLAAWMGAREARGERFLLAGDLNLMAPGEHVEGEPSDDAIALLLRRFRRLPTGQTYQPFAARPDRTLDWAFASQDLDVRRCEALPTELSDHLPIVIDLQL